MRSPTSGSPTASSSRSGIGSPPTWLPDDAARRPGVPRAREGAAGLRLARHLPLRRPARARVLPRLHDGGLDGAGVLPRRGVLDRSLLRPRVALPERRSADDDRVEGRRVDQGDDDRRRGADRGRAARLRDARPRRPGERPVLPRAGRHASRHRHQPALRRRLPAADRGRQPLSRSSRSPSRRASGPSRGSATSARAST